MAGIQQRRGSSVPGAVAESKTSHMTSSRHPGLIGVSCEYHVKQAPCACRSPSGDRSAQYGELLGKHKQANDELLKGANVSDLYNKENTAAASAANTKAGGDPKLGGAGASAPHDK